MFSVTFVGTGAAFSKKYGHTNFLIESNQAKLMIDFGYLTPIGLEKINFDLQQLTHVFISHIHADHVGGLEELAFSAMFSYHKKPHLILPGKLKEPLWNNSLSGGLELSSDESGQPITCCFEDYFDISEIDENWFELDNIKIKPFQVDHVPGKESYGVIVRDQETGKQIIFTCDVKNKLSQFTTDAEFLDGIIVHDCQLLNDGQGRVHTPLDVILTYPESVLERTYLIHYGDQVDEHRHKIEKDRKSVV